MAVKRIISNTPKMLAAFNQSLEGTEWEGILPEPRDGNLIEYGNTMFNYPKIMNAFMSNLVNLVFTVVSKMYFTNPLAFAKQGEIPYGYTIENIWVDICKAHSYYGDNPSEEEITGVLKQEKPNLKVVFHPMTRRDYYKASINQQTLKHAFYSRDGLNSLVNSIIDSLYTSNDVTEFVYQMKLFADYLDAGMIKLVKASEPVDEATSKKFLSTARQVSNAFLFPSRLNNPTGVMNTSSRDNQIVWLTAKADANVAVEGLAYMYNLDKGNLMGRVVMIPEIPGHPEIIAVISDVDYMRIYDNVFQTETKYNEETLTWTYWLHVWQTMFLSPFHNAVALTTGDIPTVTDVTITGDATYTAGTMSQYSVVVTGTNNPSQKGVWRVEGNTSPATQISDTGFVSFGVGETGNITVTFTPFADTQQPGTLSVTTA